MCVCVRWAFPGEPVKCGCDTLFPRREEAGILAFHAVIFSGLACEVSQKKMHCSRWSVQSALELFEIKLGLK